MSATLTLAWRSIWRNRRRTLISMSAASVGLLLVIVYDALMGGVYGDATRQLDSAGMGHVEVYAAGWRARAQPVKAIPDPAGLLASLPLPQGAQAGYRVIAHGLLSSARGSEGVELHGVDWALEPRLSEYVRDVRSGAVPDASDERGLLVGERLAARLELKVGSKVRLLVQRGDGEMGADLFRVRGVFHSVSPTISQRRVLIGVEAAQALVGVDGAAHQLLIQLEEPGGAEDLARTLRARLGGGFEALSFSELAPTLERLEKFSRSALAVAAVFIYFLVGLGVLNTALMSVLERTRELGVMLAVGTRPRRLVALVLAESFWIATLSVAIGLALGLAVTWLGSEHALLDYREAMGEGMDYGGVVVKSAFRTRFSVLHSLGAAAFVYVMALLVGLYPAWRVARLQPAEALRRA